MPKLPQDAAQTAAIAHILRRLTFTVHPDRMAAVATMTPADVIEQLLAEDPVIPAMPELGSDNDDGRLPAWWLEVMGSADAGVHERMVWFWHGHFTSSLDKSSPALMLRQHQVFRDHALGNFRDLFRAVATDAAMLYWLDGAGSTADEPNENFARESMELFALGRVGSPYSEDDVRAGAIAFSGWWVDGDHDDAVLFDSESGPTRNVKLLGQDIHPGERAVDDAIEAICSNPACAPHVAARIDAYFTGVEPDDDRRAALGKVLADADFEIRPLVEHILRDDVFMQSTLNRPRSAIEWFVSVQLLLDAEVDTYVLESLGQLPFSPPNVAGWPGTARWISAGAEFAKAEISLDYSGDTATLDSADPVSDVLSRAGLYAVSDATRTALEQASGAVDGRRDRSTLLHALVAVSPEFSLA